MPTWPMVKATKTPTAYSGISACRYATERGNDGDRGDAQDHDARRERQPIATEAELARHVAVAARIAASRGNALNEVFAARNRIIAVNAWRQ